MADFKSVTPDIEEEIRNYQTTPERKWWQLHKYSLVELAALTSVISFLTSFTGLRRK